MNYELSRKQVDVLNGFYAHCYCVYHDGVKQDFGFWASYLDSENIPWSLQNSVACFAEDRESQSIYFSTFLNKKGVTVH